MRGSEAVRPTPLPGSPVLCVEHGSADYTRKASLIPGGTFSNPADAAGLTDVQTEGARPSDHRAVVRAGVQPDFPDSLLRQVLHDLYARPRRHVDGGDIDRTRYVEHAGKRLVPLDLRFVRVD